MHIVHKSTTPQLLTVTVLKAECMWNKDPPWQLQKTKTGNDAYRNTVICLRNVYTSLSTLIA